MDYHVTVPEI